MRFFGDDQDWVVRVMQPIAERQIYSKVWPDCAILPLDDDATHRLKRALDIGGADKALQYPDGRVAFLAQRFRKYDCSRFDDFTLRCDRPLSGRKTEYQKCLDALDGSTMLAAYYCYGHVNEQETGFLRFRIIDFRRFLEAHRKGLIPEGELKANRDSSARFLAWPFSLLPRSIIFWEKEDEDTEPPTIT